MQGLEDLISAAIVQAMEETAKKGLKAPYTLVLETCDGRLAEVFVFDPEENAVVSAADPS